jgi:P27 family predicted phage terminase small subunit
VFLKQCLCEIMGERGPAPRPLAEVIERGNPSHNTKAELNLRHQPTPEPVLVEEPPSFLDEIAKEEWRRLAPVLFRNLLFTEVDEHQLALLCSAFSKWVAIEQELKKDSDILFRDYKGNTIVNPLLKASQEAATQLHKYLREFGMSPAARMRVRAAPSKGDQLEDAWERMVKQKEAVTQKLLSENNKKDENS